MRGLGAAKGPLGTRALSATPCHVPITIIDTADATDKAVASGGWCCVLYLIPGCLYIPPSKGQGHLAVRTI